MKNQTNGKRLLVLGGTSATLDMVKLAKSMGIYTIVTDDQATGVTKKIADETAFVSTTDIDGLCALIKEKNIDGAFCGPSEFNLRNLISLCEKTGLPCYTDMINWNKCANKDVFKKYCLQYGVDCPKEFFVDEHSSDEKLDMVDFPVIIKPVDGSSSAGISVCSDKSSLRTACILARKTSKSGKIIVEKYIENGGEIFGARYIIRDGVAYPYLLIDTYVADPVNKKSLISAFTYTPSKYSDYYINNMDASVREMICGMGLKNGSAFFQALPYNGKIYFHEMGYRLSGGMIFKLTEPLMDINDMKMMIRFALGGDILTAEEEKKLDISCSGKFGGQLMIPLNSGKIASVEGLEEIKAMPSVKDFIQYYQIGDTVEEKVIGTLGQHFGRFTFVADTQNEIYSIVDKINKTLIIKSDNGTIMNQMSFDINRAK